LRKTTIALIFAILLITNLTPIALADDFPPPTPTSVILDDGNRIFFLTPENPNLDWLEWTEQPPTGLYYNTDPPVNIYYFDYVEGECYFSNDGMHFIRISRVPIISSFEQIPLESGDYPDFLQGVIFFYKNGTLIKSYSIDDLLTDNRNVMISATSIWWEGRGNSTRLHDELLNTLTITTIEDRVITFDITTGEILNDTGSSSVNNIIYEADKNNSIIIILISVIVIITIALGAGIIIWRYVNRKKDI